MRSDTRNNAIYQYGLIHFIYKINSMGNSETRRNMRGMGGSGMRGMGGSSMRGMGMQRGY
jgi:hypothetical protein